MDYSIAPPFDVHHLDVVLAVVEVADELRQPAILELEGQKVRGVVAG